MTKYDFQLNLSTDTSDGKIISKIKPNSTVLEFGCAEGRMTKYMSDALGCGVYIVEYDKEAYKNAVRFARDGVCGDAMELEWVHRFENVRFDYVIFADVLEHLTDPALVLKNAAKALKPGGRIYVSIPNITHNDVIVKAMENRFDYTQIGLLDNTHVHFWGMENIVPFAEECGLHVDSIEATYCKSGMTEQFAGGHYDSEDVMLRNCLGERPYGEVYQFVMTLSADGDGQPVDMAAVVPHISSHIYYDAGRGFNQEDIIGFSSQMISSGRYNAHYVLSDTSSISRIRFDPVENQGCILQNVVFRQGDRKLNGIFVCGVDYGEGILMRSTDPQVVVDIVSGEPLIIDADIIIPSSWMLEEMGRAIENRAVDNRITSERIAAAEAEKEELSARLDSMIREKEQISGSLSRELSISNKRCNELEAQNISLENKLSEQADKAAVSEREIRALSDKLAENQSENAELNSRIASLENELELCQRESSALSESLEDMLTKINALSAENKELEKNGIKAEAREKEHMGSISALRSELGSYMFLFHEKEKLLISMERRINELTAEKAELEGYRAECDRLNNEISLILNRRLIRYGDKLLWFPKKVAGIFKK